ncbi:hypothetical protein [Pseudonocardia acaciae]|uniref:hypothetical protein n=1 Tax=Pseudonocardia acaciae TaxID=551276 RepID=UPI000685B873|nr:hypothetical protein [Pseudonocardia acaciae]
MSDAVWPLRSDQLPFLSLDGGFGTMFLRNSRPDVNGRYFATSWFCVVLPIVPLGRYYVRQIKSDGVKTTYEIFGKSRLRFAEVVRAYLYFWVVIPTVFLGPIIFAVERDNSNDSFKAGFVGMFISVGLLFLALGLLFLYGKYWRPVREAHFI